MSDRCAILVVAFVAACTTSPPESATRSTGSAAPAPTTTTAPAATPAPSSPPVVHGFETLSWRVANRTIEVRVLLTAASSGNLSFTDGETRHLMPVAGGDDITLRAIDGGVLLDSRELVGRAAEVGAIFSYEAMFVTWDATSNRPVATRRWSCNEAEADCTKPDWAARE